MRRTPCPSCLESQTESTVVVSGTTGRDLDTRERVVAPGLTGGTSTVAASIVIVRADGWDEDTRVGLGTHAVSALKGETVSTEVIGGTTLWYLNTLLG